MSRASRRALGLALLLSTGAAACAEEDAACASDGAAEFCVGPGQEIRGGGFEPGTRITASGGAASTDAEVGEHGWFPDRVAFPDAEEIVVEGTRAEDGARVRLALEVGRGS